MTWQRLEGSAVSADLTPGLEARIADPLWMLARQWQVGEFAGEDAARPVAMSARASWHPVGALRFGKSPDTPINVDREPLEMRVEAETVRRGPSRLRVAAEAGLQLLRMADAAGASSALRDRLRAAFALTLPVDDGSDPRGRLELELLATRSFDGLRLAQSLEGGAAPDAEIAAIAPAWLAIVQAMYTDPSANAGASWDSEGLSYGFEIAAPTFTGGTRLVAPAYADGHVDWEDFEFSPGATTTLAPHAQERRIDTVPIPLRYPGMPASRWWEFEDGAVYWGDIQGGPEDLARYLVAAFATSNGDDWFVLPLDLPFGAVAQTLSVEVTDSFGRRTVVQPVAANDAARFGSRRGWRWFELTGDPAPDKARAPRLFLPAVLSHHAEGAPVEAVLLTRDEGSNLGWAIERVVEGASGRPIDRRREAPPPEPAPPAGGAWSYRLATPMPPYFVPLVPVRRGATPTVAAMRLQRGRLATENGSGGARGLLLEADRRLLLREEEVPASGVQVTRSFQMCRSADGGVHAWVGRRKQPGREPSGAGLVHDRIAMPEAEP